MDEQLTFYICIAGAVAAAVFFLMRFFVTGKDTKLRQRLAEQAAPLTGQSLASAAADGSTPTPPTVAAVRAEP